MVEQPELEEDREEEISSPVKNNDHMFVRDDRDRFGNQIFPIAPKVNVPGPGAYEIGDTME